MDVSVRKYCRLCAENKPQIKVLDTDDDEMAFEFIVKKLSRINASEMDWTEHKLPKTFCFVCLSALESAFQFVTNVGKAQEELKKIFLEQQIKNENEIYDDLHSHSVENNFEIKTEKELDPTNVTAKKVSPRNLKKDRNKYFNTDTIPLSQLKLTWKDYNFLCSLCDTMFPTIDELTVHSMQYHNICNAYRCTDCGTRKLQLNNFLIHVQRHRKYLKMSCYKCHIKFLTIEEANLHKNVHTDTNYRCCGCNSTFSNSDSLSEHCKKYFRFQSKVCKTSFNQDLTKDLRCLHCNKVFKYKSSLKTHLLTHSERKRDHTCERCGKCFLTKQNLAQHIMKHDNIRPFQCKICKASFVRQGLLRDHVTVHDNVKPFTCEQCGRCFRLKKQLNAHSIIHTDLLPFSCDICSKGFRFKTLLTQHMRQHTGIKPYSCDICLCNFTNWQNYNRHMKRQHGKNMAKKKHTPEGLCPINPSTGELVVYKQTDETSKWKRQVMEGTGRVGRPRVNTRTKQSGSKNKINSSHNTEITQENLGNS